ncbi:hypothetical protein LSM04_004620 [Trypanosoma melophagium]|uniref:uncharacterized protein n=1 Tax=Trypanosoma melophagium TaxID=715481 RepID=UPI00351A60CA|nr:hypothetical protein LSM04_004620 [Trypanosoma melophagium]
MSWANALRTHLASTAYIQSRDAAAIFKTLSRVHLMGPPGQTVNEGGLSLLRRVRWEMLKNGTPEEKARILETILTCYANASNAYTYDPAISEKENHKIGLEQLQCLVEARLAGVPMRAAHYRYLLQSPQLSQLSPATPLLLLREMERSEGTLTDDDRVDVSVGLASAGHWEEALRLTPRIRFVDVIDQVSAVQRDGWHQACKIASHLEDEMVIQDENFLVGVTRALAIQYGATHNDSIGVRIKELLEAYSSRNNVKTLPRRSVEDFISSSSPENWRLALEFLVRHNEKVESTKQISIGKVIPLLNAANQWEKTLQLYQKKPSILSSDELQFADIHNHAFIAISKGNFWKKAVEFYETQPVKNVQTHLLFLKMVLFKKKFPFSATWTNCLASCGAINNLDYRFAEALMGYLSPMGRWCEALKTAKLVSKRAPRVLLPAIAVAAAALKDEIVWEAAVELGSARHGVSPKQLCTAAAIVACCTRKVVPSRVSDALAAGLHNCSTSQEHFDEAIFHMGRCMALLSSGTAAKGTKTDVPPAIATLMSQNWAGKTDTSWIFALEVVQKISKKGWSLEAVAPGMLSSGLDAAIAIRFLPD